MKRTHKILPGYDCRYVPCQHKHKGDHGISDDRWFYSIVADEGDLELALWLHSGVYPGTVPSHLRENYAEQARQDAKGPAAFGPSGDLSVYTTFPTTREQIGAKGDGSPFPYLAWTSTLKAAALWQEARKKGQPWAPEPTEAFWLVLEDVLATLAPVVRAERMDTKWMHCPLCGKTDHEGYVPVGPATAALTTNPKEA